MKGRRSPRSSSWTKESTVCQWEIQKSFNRTRQSILCSGETAERQLRWETAERVLRKCWETAERQLRDSWETAENSRQTWTRLIMDNRYRDSYLISGNVSGIRLKFYIISIFCLLFPPCNPVTQPLLARGTEGLQRWSLLLKLSSYIYKQQALWSSCELLRPGGSQKLS